MALRLLTTVIAGLPHFHYFTVVSWLRPAISKALEVALAFFQFLGDSFSTHFDGLFLMYSDNFWDNHSSDGLAWGALRA